MLLSLKGNYNGDGFYESVTITDVDGTKYSFGKLDASTENAIEISYAMNHPLNGPGSPVTTAWYLTKITSSDGTDEILLSYYYRYERTDGFGEFVGVMEQLGVDLNGGIATFMLRATGESYNVQSAFDLVDANANNYISDPEFVPRDGKGPLIGEASAPVKKDINNVWTVAVTDINQEKVPGAAQRFGTDISIHTHDNEGRFVSVNGRDAKVESGPRSADSDLGAARNNAGTGRFEMAEGKKSLYFYNKSGTFITINRDVFAPKNFKKN